MNDSLLDPRHLAIAALKGKGVPAQLFEGVPFVKDADIAGPDQLMQYLKVIGELGFGADIFEEGIVIRPAQG